MIITCFTDSEVALHRITKGGMPLITFSTNKTFVFSAELHCWQPISEPTDVVPRISGPLSSLMKTSGSDTALIALARPSKRLIAHLFLVVLFIKFIAWMKGNY